jgi:dTDP-4-dehydrorhamnose reductase
MPIKVLVLGSSGMAGHVLTHVLRSEPNNYTVIDVSRTNSLISPAVLLDVRQTIALKSIIDDTQPNVIVNCVGVLNHFSEKNPDEAILLNGYLPHFLERLVFGTNCKIIHISTDCVFSGKKGDYNEFDITDGEGYYAQSKAIGEIINTKDLTIRTSIIGPELKGNGTGLFHWFSKQSGEIKGYSNALWSGVTTIELANVIKEAIKHDLCGLYHLCSQGKISKKDLLQLFVQEFNSNIVIKAFEEYKVDKSLINTRCDFSYKVPSYNMMIKEMHQWIRNNAYLYEEYDHLL